MRAAVPSLTGRGLAVAGLTVLLSAGVAAQEKEPAQRDGEENASNPLASVNNTDLKYQYFDLGGSDRNDFNQTSFRFIGIKALPSDWWAKADAKVPIDWEDGNAIPASLEFQVGKMFNPNFGVFAEALIGVGGDRPYDQGVGLGLRFNY